MSKLPRLLTPEEAKRTLAHRMTPRVDRLRQFATKLGIRPYQVWLVWGEWTGSERGRGKFNERKSITLLPTPKLEDLSAVALDPRAFGVLGVGSIRLSRISASYSQDQLRGLTYPSDVAVERIPGNVEFFYEIREDGRVGGNLRRERYRIAAEPFRRAGKVDWTVLLERISEDRDREGREQIGDDA